MHMQYILRFSRLTFVVFLIVCFLIFLKYAFIFLYPFLIAIIVSIILNPFVNYIENKWRLPRYVAICTVLFLVIICFMSIIALVVSEVLQGSTMLAEKAPVYMKELFLQFQLLLEGFVYPVYNKITMFIHSLDASYQATFEDYFQSLLNTIASTGTSFLQASLLKIPALLSTFPHS
ncbi:AI-2E family transporter, partial [Virgibacillus sp. W0430]|uniref:AI-2E family transporter n=1 Tax=Virgibacillus sp. W0430 TaxID=3391580 RepID=UPI003F482122